MSQRIAVLGNSSGGKSTLARRLAVEHGLPLHEIDKLLWRPGWVLAPTEDYEAAHAEILARGTWLLDGLGRLESVGARLARATSIVLIDLPLWVHFWLAAERQLAWARGDLEHTPGEHEAMPPTKALFETIWTVEQDFMPTVRRLVDEREAQGAEVRRLATLEEVEGFRL